MSKKAMIEEMARLGIIDETTKKSLNKSLKEKVKRIYDEAVPKRLAHLASL